MEEGERAAPHGSKRLCHVADRNCPIGCAGPTTATHLDSVAHTTTQRQARLRTFSIPIFSPPHLSRSVRAPSSAVFYAGSTFNTAVLFATSISRTQPRWSRGVLQAEAGYRCSYAGIYGERSHFSVSSHLPSQPVQDSRRRPIGREGAAKSLTPAALVCRFGSPLRATRFARIKPSKTKDRQGSRTGAARIKDKGPQN